MRSSEAFCSSVPQHLTPNTFSNTAMSGSPSSMISDAVQKPSADDAWNPPPCLKRLEFSVEWGVHENPKIWIFLRFGLRVADALLLDAACDACCTLLRRRTSSAVSTLRCHSDGAKFKSMNRLDTALLSHEYAWVKNDGGHNASIDAIGASDPEK